MFNEYNVAEAVIDASVHLSWPRDKLLIQVRFCLFVLQSTAAMIQDRQRSSPYPDRSATAMKELAVVGDRCSECVDHELRGRVLQVLDDSTDDATAKLVDAKVDHWRKAGVNIVRLRRTNRQGYKAGALKEGMVHLQGVEHIAIFDADFKPDPDFLVCQKQSMSCVARPREAQLLSDVVGYRAGSDRALPHC